MAPGRKVIILGMLLLFLAAFAQQQTVRAAEFQSKMTPFSVPNQSPLALALLPFSAASARVPEKGTSSFKPLAAYSSIFTKQQSDSTSLFLDMELLSVSLRYDYVVASGIQVGLELPFVFYSSGFLDHTIQEYHDIFGFPNGGRENVPNNEMHYEVRHKGKTLIDLPTSIAEY